MSGEAIVLEARKREIIGKKVRQLRAKGEIPAVIYGPKQEPVHISVDWPHLRRVLGAAGGTHLVEIKVDDNNYNVLIRQVDRHPVQFDRVLHVDFYAVDMLKLLVTSIPVSLIKQDETESRLGGQIIQDLATIEVETLPANIPERIVVDVSTLKAIGDHISVVDLPALPNVRYVEEPTVVVAHAAHIASAAEEEETGEAMVAEPERISRRKDEDFEE